MKTYWLTRRWGTEGIRKAQGYVVDVPLGSSTYITSGTSQGTKGYFRARLGTDIFETQQEAVAYVRAAAKRKVESLEEQAAKLRKEWL